MGDGDLSGNVAGGGVSSDISGFNLDHYFNDIGRLLDTRVADADAEYNSGVVTTGYRKIFDSSLRSEDRCRVPPSLAIEVEVGVYWKGIASGGGILGRLVVGGTTNELVITVIDPDEDEDYQMTTEATEMISLPPVGYDTSMFIIHKWNIRFQASADGAILGRGSLIDIEPEFKSKYGTINATTGLASSTSKFPSGYMKISSTSKNSYGLTLLSC